MMELGPECVLCAQPQPEVVELVDIFRPEAGRVGTQVHECRGPVRRYDLEREGMPGFRKPLPGEADPASQLIRTHTRRNTRYQPRYLQLICRLDQGIKRV